MRSMSDSIEKQICHIIKLYGQTCCTLDTRQLYIQTCHMVKVYEPNESYSKSYMGGTRMRKGPKVYLH